MSWFAPKLEPGERVLLRSPALRDPMLVVLTGIAGTGILLLFFERNPDVPSMGGLRALLMVAIPLVLYWAAAILVSRAVGAGWAITDRRVLAWRGLLGRTVEQLRRDDIDRSNLDGDDLMVRGGGQSLRLYLKRVRADAVQAALGDKAPPPGQKARDLARILENGETLAWRYPPPWRRALSVAVVLAVAALLIFWFAAWLGWGSGHAGRVGLFGIPAMAIVLLAILPRLHRALAWSGAVTDRRVLLRRLHDFTRYDSIPLDAIEEIEAPHEGSHRVYLHANGQRCEFRPGNQPTAEQMYAAIQAAKAVA